MTGLEAWENLSERMARYAREHGYTDEDLQAEVLAFCALKELDEESGAERERDKAPRTATVKVKRAARDRRAREGAAWKNRTRRRARARRRKRSAY